MVANEQEDGSIEEHPVTGYERVFKSVLTSQNHMKLCK